MTDPPNPWGTPPPPKRPAMPVGLLLWLVLLAAVGIGIWLLAGLLPGRVETTEDYARVGYAIILIAAVSSGLIFARRVNPGRVLRDLALWGCIVAVLAVGYTYRDEMQRVGARVLAEFLPGYAAPSGAGELVLSAGQDGHFRVIATVNGKPITFLVDTGASDIVLAPADARRLGIDTRALNFSLRYETANGIGRAAPTTLASFVVGGKTLVDQRAAINQADMRESLLGMAFFRGRASFEMRGPTLFIRWH